MRRIKLFEEFVQLISPKKKVKDVNKSVVIIPDWNVY